MEINKIYNMDCLEGMKQLESNSISLAVTDPPFLINYKSSFSKDRFEKIKNDDNNDWVKEFFYELNRVLKNNSALYIFTGYDSYSPFYNELIKFAKIKNLITIPRGNKGGGGGNSYFSPQHEFVIYANKGHRKFEKTKILKPSKNYKGGRNKDKELPEFLYKLPDYWDWTKASVHNSKQIHPTEKTIECVESMIQLSSDEGDLILDPFMGVGGVALACIRNKRNFIGFEIEKDYYDKANERIKQELVTE